MLKIDDILEIIKAVNQSAINRFELEQDATRLVLVKEDGEVKPKQADQSTLANSLCEKVQQMPAAVKSAADTIKTQQTTAAATDLYTLPAPMIGTFYAAPEPGAEPFAKVGQQVQAGTIVCVLEAMKLFNEIEAGIEGEITEVLVKDGQFVEYGQPLFVIKLKDN